MTYVPTIETRRLRLRSLAVEDLDDLARILGDPEVVKHIGPGRPATREESEIALHSIRQHWEQHGYGRWAVIHRQHRNFIGIGGIRSLQNRCVPPTGEVIQGP